MDKRRFDGLAKHLYVLKSRPEGRRFLLTTLAAGFAAFAGPDRAVACRRKGELCNKNGQCCSNLCGGFRRRKLKNKKGRRRDKRVGKCGCSLTREPCKVAADCCADFDACGISNNKCAEGSVCCHAAGFRCGSDCDCCGPNICGSSGTCEQTFCRRTQEPCDSAADCCSEDDMCGTLDPACEPVAATVCCGVEGSSCEEDCDCCGGNICGGNGACQPSPCLPSEKICEADQFEPCCPSGSSCTQPGCVTDQPRTCPVGADTCARPAVFCAETRPLDCACFLDIDGSSFCSLGFSCGQECSSHAECEAPPGSPGSRCIRCPATCGHNRGVCASSCPSAA